MLISVVKETVNNAVNNVAVAASIIEALEGYEKTMIAVGQKLDEVAAEKKALIADKDTLLNQNEWLSGVNTKLVERDAQLLNDYEELLQKNAALMEAAKASASVQEALQELQTAHATLQEEKEIATRNLNLLEEKIGTSEELQKQAESLAAEIQDLTGGKENLISEIEMLKKEKGFVDLHDWIRRTMRLGELAENKSTPEGREEAREILRNTPDLLVRYNPISNLYEYAVGNGSG